VRVLAHELLRQLDVAHQVSPLLATLPHVDVASNS
jgi:hypothetical protein